jgi:surface polysaccharide O-acyltransferase-like enzyme
MDKTIDIKKGTLVLSNSGLEIQDDSNFNRNLLIISSVFWCFYGILNIVQYPAKENYFYFYFGVFILALWVVVIGFVIRKVTFEEKRIWLFQISKKCAFGKTRRVFIWSGPSLRRGGSEVLP